MFTGLASMVRHDSIRQSASECIDKSREAMKQRYEKINTSKLQIFSVGDNVSVRIPVKDRTSTDLLRLPCRVIEVTGDKIKYYKLLTRHGQLRCKYRAGDLEKFDGTFNKPIDAAKENIISLRTASSLENTRNTMQSNPR